jgi:hypothetical protein
VLLACIHPRYRQKENAQLLAARLEDVEGVMRVEELANLRLDFLLRQPTATELCNLSQSVSRC